MIRSTVDFCIDIKKLESEQTDKETLRVQLSDLQHYNYICCAYYRLEWLEKLHFLEDLVKNLQSIGSLSLLLNTLHSSLRKMGRYNNDNAFDFDIQLMDHNRMFQDNLITNMHEKNLEWYKSLKDKIQESLIISLLRSSGGSIIIHTYKVLKTEYRLRLTKLKNSTANPHAENPEEPRRTSIAFANDEGNPLHKKCQKLRNEYNAMILAYKAEIFGKSSNKEKSSAKKDKKNKNKKSKSKKKTKKTKKGKHEEDSDLTRIELMPMWAVKKIFSYLDAKSLTFAKKVNSYWKYAIDELIKEQKTRQFINQTIAKLSSEIDYSYINTETQTPKQSKKSFHEKKMAELKQRGAILEELRCDENLPMEQYSVFLDILKEISIHNVHPFKCSTVHPRATKTNERCYNEPNVLYKDVNLIVSNQDAGDIRQKLSSFYVPTNSQLSSLVESETNPASCSSSKKSTPSIESL